MGNYKYGLCKLAGTRGGIASKTVSDVKKVLARLVSLDLFFIFGTHIATYNILKINIAVLVQHIGNYSQD